MIGFAVGVGIGFVGFCFRSVRMREHGLHSHFILLNQMFIVGGGRAIVLVRGGGSLTVVQMLSAGL